MAKRELRWTEEQTKILRDQYGEVADKYLAGLVGKTVSAVKNKAVREGLKKEISYLSAQCIADLLKIDNHVIIKWIKEKGLKSKRGGNSYQIELADLVVFLRDNQDLWDSRKLDLFALSQEPEWLREKRRKDMMRPPKEKKNWTKEEDELLKAMYKANLSLEEIASRLFRTKNGVKHRLYRIDVWNVGNTYQQLMTKVTSL